MALYDGGEVSDELLREFLAVCLMAGGRVSAYTATPKDVVDEFLSEHGHPDVFEPTQNRGLLSFVDVNGEHDYYEVTEEGMEFVRGLP